MINDPNLSALFASESDEHINTLEQGLLQLEREQGEAQSAQRQECIESIFRAAHSLKGAARMLGLLDIEAFAHHLEDVLSALRRGKLTLSAAQIRRLLHATDILRQLSAEALRGTTTATDLAAEMHQLDQLLQAAPDADIPAPAPTPAPTAPPASTSSDTTSPPDLPAPVEPVPSAAPQNPPPLSPPVSAERVPAATAPTGANADEPWENTTLRVPTASLDTLLTHAGELVVCKTYANRHIQDLQKILQQSETLRNSLRPDDPVRQLALHLEATLEQLNIGFAAHSNRLTQLADDIADCTHELSMMPLGTLFGRYPRMVHDTAAELGKKVELDIEGSELRADKRIIEQLRAPLMHMLRNAVVHGCELPEVRARLGKPAIARINLTARIEGGNLHIDLRDDGPGFDLAGITQSVLRQKMYTESACQGMTPQAMIRLALNPGVSAVPYITELAGRGVGLDVVNQAIRALKGELDINSTPGQGSHFRLTVPLALISDRVLLARYDGQYYAFPIEHVVAVRRLAQTDLYPMEGHLSIVIGDEAVPVADLGPLLRINPHAVAAEERRPCVILRHGQGAFGVFVDILLDELEIILKPKGTLLQRVRNVLGFTLLESGDVCTLLNPGDLFQSILKQAQTQVSTEEQGEENARRVILLVEDSVLTRTMEQRILEDAGYSVVTAVDGVDGFNKLANQRFDAVVSDIVMPNLDGLGLAKLIRQDKHYADIPVILVTSLCTDEDKRRGLEVGANAYIPKPTFSSKMLLDTLDRLL